MNFVPQPDPRKQIMADLEAGITHYLATGKRIQDVAQGASGLSPVFRNKKKKASASNASTD
jgi:hypothetical protein